MYLRPERIETRSKQLKACMSFSRVVAHVTCAFGNVISVNDKD